LRTAHRIRLNPTPEQEKYFFACADVARSTWNWALAEYNRQDAEGLNPSVLKLKKQVNSLLASGVNSWMLDVQSYARQYAFQDLQAAISRYFKMKEEGLLVEPKGGKKRKDHRPFGWPRFKRRNDATPGFGVANNGCMQLDGHSVRISRCPGGSINMAEELRFDGKVMGGRVTYQGGHWYLAVSVVILDLPPSGNQDSAGVDLGIKSLAVTSNGEVYENPRALARYQRKIDQFNRELSRRTEDGKNWKKTKKKLSRVNAKVADVRREAHHEATTQFEDHYGVVALETLNIECMKKNHKSARSTSDAAMGEFGRQLTYKAERRGGKVVKIDKWFPSTKMCSACGHKQDGITLKVREWTCDACGAHHDRDLNAAINIHNEGLRVLSLEGSTEANQAEF